MLKVVKYLYHNTAVGRTFINFLFKIHNYFRIYFIEEEKFILDQYKKVFNVLPDVKNPKTLNEKIIWLKINDRTELHTKCADKLLVRDYVKKNIGSEYLIPIYFHSKNINDLIPENFPKDESFILKTNHNSSGGIIVSDLKLVDWKGARKKIGKLLKQNYYYQSKEWQYKNISPCFLAEKLLKDRKGGLPFDYKFHCLNGKVEVVQVDLDRFSNHKRNLYSKNWSLLPYTWSQWKNNKPLWSNGYKLKKPDNLSDMILLAEKLSRPFVYVRIDLYNVDGSIYFGEITFHHGGGCERIYPEIWDSKLGAMVDLDKIIKVNNY